MPLVPMKDLLVKAKAEGYAVGAFSIVDYATPQAVVDAAEVNVPEVPPTHAR